MSRQSSIEKITDNFWELKEYQRTVRRLENGYKLSSDLMAMLHERMDIEKTYQSSLTKWSSKWNQFLETGPEYGTARTAWQAFCVEANEMASVHKDIRDRLEAQVLPEIKQWQKENFHKSHIPPQHIKEVKQLDQNFENAQKPWSKRFKAAQQCRKEYHASCKAVQSARDQLNNAKASLDTAGAGQGNDQSVLKLEEKLSKAEKEQSRTKEAYEKALRNLDEDVPRYMEDMAKVFEASQEKERNRLENWQQIFLQVHDVLDISKNIQISQTYAALRASIESMRVNEDVSWWAENYGCDMPLHCPIFQEYSADGTATLLKQQQYKIRTLRGTQSPSKTSRGNTFLKPSDNVLVASVAGGRSGRSSPALSRHNTTIAAPPVTLRPGTPSREHTQSLAVPAASVPKVTAAAAARSASPARDLDDYDERLNPFAAEEAAAEKTTMVTVTTTTVAVTQSKPPSQSQEPAKEATVQKKQIAPTQQPTNSGNPFGDDMDEEDGGSSAPPPPAPTPVTPAGPASPSAHGKPCEEPVKVRALFDYNGEKEEQELTFKAGEEFLKLTEEDENGWCQGHLSDGTVGLYPATYAAPI